MTTLKKLLVVPMTLAMLAIGGVGSVGAQTAPVLAIQLATTGLTSPLVAGQTATVARLILDTSGNTESVRVNSLPFILTLGGNASSTALTNCRVTNEANGATLAGPIGTTTGLVAGLNTINLNSPLILAPNTVTTLALQCDPSAAISSGGSFTFSMNTANVSATGVTTGLPATVVVRGSGPIIPTPTGTGTPPTPGLPNTGAGGDAAQNWAIILSSAALAILGFAYAKRYGRKA